MRLRHLCQMQRSNRPCRHQTRHRERCVRLGVMPPDWLTIGLMYRLARLCPPPPPPLGNTARPAQPAKTPNDTSWRRLRNMRRLGKRTMKHSNSNISMQLSGPCISSNSNSSRERMLRLTASTLRGRPSARRYSSSPPGTATPRTSRGLRSSLGPVQQLPRRPRPGLQLGLVPPRKQAPVPLARPELAGR